MAFADQFRIKPSSDVSLDKISPNGKPPIERAAAEAETEKNLARLRDLQEKLYAEHGRSVLICLQAMDAGGKDGTIAHIFSGVNPQGCRVVSFKKPTPEELDHDFLWRIHKNTPAKGEMTIFNRSHYEDVLVVRVHGLVPEKVWKARYDHINDFEAVLTSQGTHVLKFFLHISPDEQLERLEKRVNDPAKFWKVESADLNEREHWKEYMAAYEDVLKKCSTEDAPWFVIPADKKWYRDYIISKILVEHMDGMALQPPKPPADLADVRARIAKLRQQAKAKP